MRWYASIYSVEPVGDDPDDTQRVLQLSFIFEADNDEEAARKKVAAVMPAVCAQLQLPDEADSGLDMEFTPLAKHIATCENRFKDLKEQAAVLSGDEEEPEYDGL